MLSIEGNIVGLNKTYRGRVEIGEDGKILSLGNETGRADMVFGDELIFPGFIDVHVHARESASHDQDYKEDFASAGQAAVNGGLVAFADMPNNNPPPVDDASYAEKLKLSRKSLAEVILYAAIGPDTKPLSINVPYKVFMGQSVGSTFFGSSSGLEDKLKQYEGQSVSFHCEQAEALAINGQAGSHSLRRPREAEIQGVRLALSLIQKYNLRGKICHISAAEAAAEAVAAKRSGLPVTIEVAPHHLFFSEENETSFGNLLQVNPPVRQKSDCEQLLEYLRLGEIDFLATDHAPHTLEEKQRGISGLPHLDTYGPFVAWLMKERGFTAQEIARVCSYNPGRFISQFAEAKYGEIKEGFAASLTVLDLSKPIKVTREILKTKCGWSPFEGREFPGQVVCAFIKGKICKPN